jgi:hypothetical protein
MSLKDPHVNSSRGNCFFLHTSSQKHAAREGLSSCFLPLTKVHPVGLDAHDDFYSRRALASLSRKKEEDRCQERQDTCMSCEEEDTCMSYEEEEDTCLSYEEEDTCMSYEEEDT